MTFTRQYSFPNVSVRETVRGPQQFTSSWRNTIGVAAPFNKGPLLAQITSRQELVNLYGEDNSLGSIAIRQAMLQGATNFVISRALPKAKGATGAITITNAEGSLNQEPLIGSNDNRTVGLNIQFSFISPVITTDNNLIAYSRSNNVERATTPVINTKSFLSNLDFDGIGSLVLRRVNTLSKDNYGFFLGLNNSSINATPSDGNFADFSVNSVTVGAGSPSNSFPVMASTQTITIKVLSTNLTNSYVEAIKPNMQIKAGLNGPTFENGYAVVTSEVSSVVEAGNSYYSFTISGRVTASGTAATLKLDWPDFPEVTTTTDFVIGSRIFKVKILKSDLEGTNQTQAFTPGMRIKGATNGPTFENPDDDQDTYATIISELENEDSLHYSFYVEGNVTAIGGQTAGAPKKIKLALPASEQGEKYPILDVFRLFFIPNSSDSLPGEVKYFGATPTTVNFNNLPIGYFVFNRHDNVGQSLPIAYYTTNNDGTLSLNPTGVTYAVGSVSDDYAYIVANNQTINIAKTTVTVGETNSEAAGFPNTELAFPPNTPIVQVLDSLKQRLNSNTILTALNADINVNSSNLPYSLTITLGAEGEIGNNLLYKVDRVSTGIGVSDIEFEDNGDLFGEEIGFVGGLDEVTPATKFFYNRQGRPVLYIEALSPGLSGNNIRVNVKPVDSSNFLLEVRELVPAGQKALPTESYYLSNTTVDLATGIYPETLSSKLVRAYYIPVIDAIGSGTNTIDFNQSPVRVAPPDFLAEFSDISFETHPSHVGAQYTQNIALTGGSEPAAYESFVPEEAYLDAIDRLSDQDVAFIIAPGIVAGDVRYERAINSLIQQADQATPYNGLRIAVISAPPKLTPSRAQLLNSQYSSPNLVIVGGWSSLATARGIGLNQYSPEGFYAGMLSVSDTYVSPASSYNNNFVVGVRNVDTDSRLASLDAYTTSNIEMLYVDRVTGKVKFLNGRTTAGNLDNRWVSIRRQSQHLIMNIVRNLEWARSAPNDPETRARVASAVDALLKTEQRRGAIAGFTPTAIDSSNYDRIAQGFMDIVITWTPIFPADYISVELIRTISNQFSLQLNS